MNKLVFLGFAGVVTVAFAGPTGDRPDAAHPWAVHDENRPMPTPVATKDNCPPSDAIVLFDGTQESIDRNWNGDGGKPTKWTVKDGAFICTPKSGGVSTKRTFADCWLWESHSYRADDKVRSQIDACSVAYVERLKKMPRPLTGEQREEIRNMAQFVGMGIRNHLFKRDDPLAQTILQMKDL